MNLKRKYSDMEEIPEEMRALFSEIDGEYIMRDIQIDGYVGQDKHREFVNNNKALHRRNEEMAGQLSELSEAMEALQKTAQASDVTKRENETMVERLAKLEAAAQAKDAELIAERHTNKVEKLKGNIRQKAADAGGLPKALSRIADTLVPEFDYYEGEIVKHKGGRPVLSDDNAGQYISVEERLVSFAREEDYLFGSTSGDAAPGSTDIDLSNIDPNDNVAMGEAALRLADKMQRDGVRSV